MSRGLFIIGTGTGVGKTYVAALVARELVAAGQRVGVYKPVASGCERREGKLVSPDALALWEAAGRPAALEHVCPQRFAAPLAPHLAARAEGRHVDARLLREGLNFWRASSDIVLVEGAGGLMSPLSDDDYNADLAAEFGYPLLVVSANVLGTINATLQTLITASVYCEGLEVAGVVLNSPKKGPKKVSGTISAPPETASATELKMVPDTFFDPSVDSNADELARRCVPPLLATVEYGGALDRAVDWWNLCATACDQ